MSGSASSQRKTSFGRPSRAARAAPLALGGRPRGPGPQGAARAPSASKASSSHCSAGTPACRGAARGGAGVRAPVDVPTPAPPPRYCQGKRGAPQAWHGRGLRGRAWGEADGACVCSGSDQTHARPARAPPQQQRPMRGLSRPPHTPPVHGASLSPRAGRGGQPSGGAWGGRHSGVQGGGGRAGLGVLWGALA